MSAQLDLVKLRVPVCTKTRGPKVVERFGKKKRLGKKKLFKKFKRLKPLLSFALAKKAFNIFKKNK